MHPANLKLEPHSRSVQVLECIARRGATTIGELCDELSVTATAVRQQVNRLLAEGLVQRRHRSNGRGRPADVFSLTAEGRRLFAHDVDAFTQELLREIADRDGVEHLDELLRRVHARMTSTMRATLGVGTPAETITRIVEQLRQRGGVAEARNDDGDGVHLEVYTCPYHGLNEAKPRICDLERQTLQELTGQDVQLEQRVDDGHSCCAFRIQPKRGNGNGHSRTSSQRTKRRDPGAE